MSTKEIEIENLGVNKNKGQGWNAWIRAKDKMYYSKFCQDEEEGKAAIGDLKPGDSILLKFTVKNGFNNFQSWQVTNLDSSTAEKKAEPEPQNTEPKNEREEKIVKAMKFEQKNEEEALQTAIDAHYKEAIIKARTLVDSVMQREDPAYPAVLAVIVDRLTSPLVYLIKDLRKGK